MRPPNSPFGEKYAVTRTSAVRGRRKKKHKASGKKVCMNMLGTLD